MPTSISAKEKVLVTAHLFAKRFKKADTPKLLQELQRMYAIAPTLIRESDNPETTSEGYQLAIDWTYKQALRWLPPVEKAAAQGDVGRVAKLLKGGWFRRPLDINGADSCNAPLSWAVLRGHVEMVRFLLDRGADINTGTSCNGTTPLQCAIATANLDLVRALVAHGAGIEAAHIRAGKDLDDTRILECLEEHQNPEAGSKPTEAAGSSSPPRSAWRQLITDCPKCDSQFKWLDRTPSEDAPFCPNCGYDAVYNGRRESIDGTGALQQAILPPLPTGIVRCDKCGATNRSTGAPVELMMTFSMHRCQSCQTAFCLNCLGAFAAREEPCPQCDTTAQFVSEDYKYV